MVVELRGRIDIERPKPVSCLHDDRAKDGDAHNPEQLGLRHYKPDGDGRSFASRFIHIQSGVSGGRRVRTVHKHIFRDADILVVELRGRIDFKCAESEPCLCSGGIICCKPHCI